MNEIITPTLLILLISAMFAGIAFLLIKSNEKRVKKMTLNKGDEVVIFNKIGTVIEDGDKVKIEIIVPRHMVSKIKKSKKLSIKS